VEARRLDREARGATWEIVAIRYATLIQPKSRAYYRFESYGEPDADIPMDYFFWVLRSDAHTIVVDTGFDPAAGARRGRTCLCPPLEALARVGVESGAVEEIVITHLHYDHIGNLAAFPRAELHVPERELDFWTSPMASRFHFHEVVEAAEIARVEDARRDGRVRPFARAADIAPGIHAIDVGGHSPGQAILIVSTAAGEVVLTSDAIHFYEELELDRPFGVFADLREMYAAYDVLRDLAAGGRVLVPGHDPQVMERFPGLGGDAAGIAVKVA
jgi:glyoxylase-like metal-dependent hydrolase (beta-lactamase superfamily II)